jgi:CDP-paratose synthetase
MKIFIFGASGYLGSSLVNYLKDKHEVFACVRTSSSHTRLTCDDSKIITGIEKDENLVNAFKVEKPDLIINTAALYGRKGEGVDKLVDANILFPSKLYELCKKYNVKSFINTGTSLPDNVSPYALTKNMFVKLVKCMNGKNLKFINIALEHFYGPNDDDSKFTSYVINACLTGQELNLTKGKQLRDFIYIDDVVSAFECIINNQDIIGHCETIPLGSGIAPSVREFVETVYKAVNSKSVLNFGTIPERENELMHSCANIQRLKQLCWEPQYSMTQGVESLVLSMSTNDI